MTLSEIQAKYTRVVRANGQYHAKLVVGNQSFRVGIEGTKEEAEWYAEMLAKAIQRLLEENAVKQPTVPKDAHKWTGAS